jgi:translation initiation factor IF-2
LARGKRPASSPAPTTAAGPVEYTPTAIEIVNAPREYKNPFAPVSAEPVSTPAAEPAAVISEPAPVAPTPAPVAHVPEAAPAPAPVRAHVSPAPAEMFPLDDAPASAPAEVDEKAELNILPPERQKEVEPQTWESDGFRPAPSREPRNDRPRAEDRPRSEDRPRRDDRREGERREEVPVPSKFRYERAKDGPLPPRPPPAGVPAQSVPTPHKSGGFLGWLKSLFGGKPAATPSETQNGDLRPEGRDGQRHRRHRGGRDRGNFRGQGGGQPQPGGESQGQGNGRGNDFGDRRDDGYRRRRRGGRGRSGGYGGDRHGGGGGAGGPPAT